MESTGSTVTHSTPSIYTLNTVYTSTRRRPCFFHRPSSRRYSPSSTIRSGAYLGSARMKMSAMTAPPISIVCPIMPACPVKVNPVKQIIKNPPPSGGGFVRGAQMRGRGDSFEKSPIFSMGAPPSSFLELIPILYPSTMAESIGDMKKFSPPAGGENICHSAGIRTVNVLPCPGTLSTSAVPPWSRAIWRTMYSPSPVPSPPLRAAST